MGSFFLQSSDDSTSNVIFIIMIIIYAVVQFLMGTKKPEKKSQTPTPVEEEDEEEEEFFEEEPVASPQVVRQAPKAVVVPPVPQQGPREISFDFSPALESFKPTTTIENRKMGLLHVEERSGEALVSSHLKKLASQNVPQAKETPHVGLDSIFAKIPPKKMLILSHEILSKPLSIRKGTERKLS